MIGITHNQAFCSFSYAEIAGWALKDARASVCAPLVGLPPIQRGFVWKPEQIERLWDSITRGFPIGSLLMERSDPDQEARCFEGTQPGNDQVDYLLLDGQQRVTSIIKGFQNIWTVNQGDITPVSALWVDLAPKDMHKTDRIFLFRLITKSHPWGYQRVDPAKPLSANNTYEALKVFRKLHMKPEVRPHAFDIQEVFPWDAEAPIPLALLICAIEKHDDDIPMVAKFVIDLLNETLIWKNKCRLRDSSVEGGYEKLKRVEEILEAASAPGSSGNFSGYFQGLIQGLRDGLRNGRVPAPVLNTSNLNSHQEAEESDRSQPAFNLFKRINSGGTTLSNEEIQYSLLKSKWPEAPKVIEEDILQSCQLTPPARMTMVMVRLFLMVNKKTVNWETSESSGLQVTPTIKGFQDMLTQKDDGGRSVQTLFKEFCEHKGKQLIEECWDFLRYSKETPFGLPKMLAARLARQHNSDLLLLLLY